MGVPESPIAACTCSSVSSTAASACPSRCARRAAFRGFVGSPFAHDCLVYDVDGIYNSDRDGESMDEGRGRDDGGRDPAEDHLMLCAPSTCAVTAGFSTYATGCFGSPMNTTSFGDTYCSNRRTAM